MDGKQKSWHQGRADELRGLIDTSIARMASRLAVMPERFYAEAGVDKAGMLSLLEQASVALEAVHGVVAGLPPCYGPVSQRTRSNPWLHLREHVAILQRHHSLYEALFDPGQPLVTLSRMRTRGNVRIRVVEGEFLVPVAHLIRTA